MPRKPLQHYFGAVYHVMSRGNNRQRIFYDDAERQRYLALLSEGVKRFEHQIHAFCLMDNHVHLVIQVSSTPISHIMHNINSRFSKYINSRQEKVGHLFQGRYKAQLVMDRDYLVRLIRYVHLNPVKANMVILPEKYRWSSYLGYLKMVEFKWLTTDWVLQHFLTGKGPALKQFIGYHQESIKREQFDEELLSEIEALSSEKFEQVVRRDLWKQGEYEYSKASFDSIIEFCCQHHGVSTQALMHLPYQRRVVACRASIGWLASHLEVQTVKATAEFFGRHPVSFSRLKNKWELKNLEGLLELKKAYLAQLYGPPSGEN